MSPCFETHFRLYRVITAMQLGTDAKKPVPRADFLAERIPSDIFNLFSKFCPQIRGNQIGSGRSSTSACPGKLACCIGVRMRELSCVQFRVRRLKKTPGRHPTRKYIETSRYWMV